MKKLTSKMSATHQVEASFRDPSGFMFWHEGVLYRQINESYAKHYDFLMASGLYAHLTSKNLIVEHEEARGEIAQTQDCYKVIRPQHLAFISYPYEWSFGQLKAAALVTLQIQKEALEYGMTLKDSSAYNIQFRGGQPVLIDTLSFEIYEQGDAWTPYRQFCQHFLAPLALMSYSDSRLGQLLRVHLDGVPLDLVAKILPWRARLRLSLFLHIFLHARSQQRYRGRAMVPSDRDRKLSLKSLQGLIDNLEQGIQKLKWQDGNTPWSDYYDQDSYTRDAFSHKEKIVSEFVDEISPDNAWDLGANRGVFSRILSKCGIPTIAWDSDAGAVEANYQQVVQDGERNLLPLLIDLTNPSPAIGWNHRERKSLAQRGPVHLIMALALIHHLAIGNNVPLQNIAAYFAELCQFLIVEFVPKEDPKVKVLLATRKDIFPHYNVDGFENAFTQLFLIRQKVAIPGSARTMYLMEAKSPPSRT